MTYLRIRPHVEALLIVRDRCTLAVTNAIYRRPRREDRIDLVQAGNVWTQVRSHGMLEVPAVSVNTLMRTALLDAVFFPQDSVQLEQIAMITAPVFPYFVAYVDRASCEVRYGNVRLAEFFRVKKWATQLASCAQPVALADLRTATRPYFDQHVRDEHIDLVHPAYQ